METSTPEDEGKRRAAGHALALLRDGMLVGLGTGSTARYFIDGVGERVAQGLRVSAVATSEQTASQARALGIRLLDQVDRPLDLAVDGADEVDPTLNCLKGRGGALLREKVVAEAARRFVLIVDESKLVERLGRGPVPVEVLPFLWRETSRRIERIGGQPVLRGGPSAPFNTDNGNLVLDVTFGSLREPAAVAHALKSIAGVIEHGLFIGVARSVIVGSPRGVRVLGDPMSAA